MAEDAVLNPLLRALMQALHNGDRDALPTFWREVAAVGTPLWAPAPVEPGQGIATFLWRGGDEVSNVGVVSALARWRVPTDTMRQLPGTDVWRLSYTVPADMRTRYKLAPNENRAPLAEGESEEDRASGWQRDPLSRRTFTYAGHEGGLTDTWSVLEGPDAPPQPWLAAQPGTPSGSLREVTMASQALGEERRLWVYTPPGYGVESGPHDLLVFADGSLLIGALAATTTLDTLQAAGRLAPPVAVFLDTDRQRMRDLDCSPLFNDFLVGELLPWMRRHYPAVTHDPRRTLIGGLSLGGNAAVFAALRHPEVFGNVLACSGAFWRASADSREHEWLARQVAAGPGGATRFYLEVGNLELWPTPDDGPSLLLANLHLRTVLRAKGYTVCYREFCGGHEPVCWRGGLADGLMALLGSAAAP